jgi:VIT1/CCC1 family predicted Fe2+/Mn2+ transporter
VTTTGPRPLRTIPSKPQLDGISDEDLREHIAQTSARLEAGIRAIDRLVEQGAEHSKQLASNTDAIRSMEITLERNAMATAQRLDNLAKAVTLAAQRGRSRDAEIERRANEARTHASGAHRRVDSQENWAKEQAEAARIHQEQERKRLEEEARANAERDRKIAELQAKQQRIADEEAKYVDAANAGAAIAKRRSDKLATNGALGAGGLAPIVTAFIAALNGQSLTYVLVLGLGIGVAIVGGFFLLRHFRKAKS